MSEIKAPIAFNEKEINILQRHHEKKNTDFISVNLPPGPCGRHAGLTGQSVGAVLLPYHGLARYQNVLVKVPLVLTGNLHS